MRDNGDSRSEMTDTIEGLRAYLAEAGPDPAQVQRGGAVTSWDEGAYVCKATADGAVLRQLGRTREGAQEALASNVTHACR